MLSSIELSLWRNFDGNKDYKMVGSILYKLALDYNQITYCTVPLSYIHSNFKIIEEICKRNKERWK